LAIGGIVVGLVSPIVTFEVWRRSGSRIKVSLEAVELNANRLMDVVRVEVRAFGAQPIGVRRLELGSLSWASLSTVGSSGERTGSRIWSPTDGLGPLRRTITPTGYLTSDVPIMDLAVRCGMDAEPLLLARAVRGDGEAQTSKVVAVRTPARVEFK
jgi:hypothetical protein